MLYSLAYLKNLVRDPNIASITPTSRFGIKHVCDKMDFPNTKAVVEYGPATGVFTKYFLDHLSSTAKVIAIDTNEHFLKILSTKIQDPRLLIAHDSAANVREIVAKAGIEKVDYVISGIPFTMLPKEVADGIVQATWEILSVGGKFLVYQFWKPESENTPGIHRYLPKYFSRINRESQWLNIPPLWIYEAIKTA